MDQMRFSLDIGIKFFNEDSKKKRKTGNSLPRLVIESPSLKVSFRRQRDVALRDMD